MRLPRALLSLPLWNLLLSFAGNVSPIKLAQWHEFEGGQAYGIALSGQNAFIAAGDKGMLVMDLSDPRNPQKLSSLSLPSFAVDITIDGRLAYIANLSAGLAIVDIADPTQPKLLGGIKARGDVWDVAIAGKYAYLASSGYGLDVVDISNAAQPTIAGGFQTSGYGGAVRVAGSVVYLGDGSNGVKFFDITTPSTPTQIGVYTRVNMAPDDILVSGSTTFIADNRTGLLELDCTNPNKPVLVKSALVSAYSIALKENQIYVSGDRTIASYDVSNHLTNKPTGKLSNQFFNRDLALFDHYAGVASMQAGLQIIDLQNPTNLTRVAWYPTSEGAQEVSLRGNLAAVANDWAGLVLLDVTDGARPKKLSRYMPGGVVLSAAFLNDTTVCIARGPEGLEMLDIANVNSPAAVSTITNVTVNVVRTFGNLALFATTPAGFRIVDLTNPGQPVTLATVSLNYRINDILIAGTLACLSLASHGVMLVDISNPVQPNIIKDFVTGQYPNKLALKGQVLFMSDIGVGVELINISNPAAPNVLATYNTPGQAQGLATWNNLLFIADGYKGTIEIADITNPAQPASAGQIVGTAYFNSVVERNGLLYTANGDNGVGIYSITNQTPALQIKVAIDLTSGLWILTLSDANGKTWTESEASNIQLEESPNLLDWSSTQFQRTWSDGVVRFSIPDLGQSTHRFYRARSP